MPIGTAVHERTFQLCESLNYREWSGYYTVSAYETHHEHEYNAIRNAAALIDVSPLFKYMVRGRDAAKFVNRRSSLGCRRRSHAGVRVERINKLRRRQRGWFGCSETRARSESGRESLLVFCELRLPICDADHHALPDLLCIR